MEIGFDNIIICVKPEKKYNLPSFWDLRRYFITKNDYNERQGYKFSHICEMNIAFISDLRKMTYEHHHKQPKQMIEWVLIKKLHKNAELKDTFRNLSHPLIRKYKSMFPPEENEDLI